MTGYGRAEVLLEGGKLTVEIRSVNGKNADISLKTSLLPKDKEMPLRKKIADRLQRGTIDVFVGWEPNASGSAKVINRELAMDYYRQIRELAGEVGAVNFILNDPNQILSTILRMPDVLDSAKQEVITADNWPQVEKAFDEALEAIVAYRVKEGEALRRDVCDRVKLILSLEDEVEGYESERIATVRDRIVKTADDLRLHLDPERLERRAHLAHFVLVQTCQHDFHSEPPSASF